MTFQKLTKEERAEWRSLPATRAAIAMLRERAASHGERALSSLRNDEPGDATMYAGGEEALRVSANILEND